LSCWSPATLERAKKESLLANTILAKSLALILARWERALARDSLRLSNIWACGDQTPDYSGRPPPETAEGAS